MGKPPTFIVDRGEPPDVDRDEEMARSGASPKAAKGVYIAIVIALVVLFALVGIGLHIPTGG